MSARDGGPAFPTLGDEYVDAPNHGRIPKSPLGMQGAPGMSLRDYFAASMPAEVFKFQDKTAMEAIAGAPWVDSEDPVEEIMWQLSLLARIRYAYADAMLAERERAK